MYVKLILERWSREYKLFIGDVEVECKTSVGGRVSLLLQSSILDRHQDSGPVAHGQEWFESVRVVLETRLSNANSNQVTGENGDLLGKFKNLDRTLILSGKVKGFVARNTAVHLEVKVNFTLGQRLGESDGKADNVSIAKNYVARVKIWTPVAHRGPGGLTRTGETEISASGVRFRLTTNISC